MAQLQALPVQAQDVAEATRADPVLRLLLNYLRRGWPPTVSDKLSPFWRRKEELCIESECIMRGCRAVIPEKLQQKVLDELHREHPGVVRMKMQVRNHVWWPKLDKYIERCATSACSACQATKNSPARAPLHPWVWPMLPGNGSIWT